LPVFHLVHFFSLLVATDIPFNLCLWWASLFDEISLSYCVTYAHLKNNNANEFWSI
jgi:hypothetical protein